MSSNTKKEKTSEKTKEMSSSVKKKVIRKPGLIRNLHALGAVLTLVQAITAALFIYLMSGNFL